MKLDNINWYKVYKRWTANSGPFEYLFKSSPFVTAKYMDDFELKLDKEFIIKEGLRDFLKNSIKADRILLIDVEVSLGVKIAVALNNELNTAPILSYNFLFHPFGLVGNRGLMEDLVIGSELIKPVGEAETFAFILDSSRYNEALDINNPMLFNNQYEITDEEMPDLNTLNRLNIKEASFLYKGAVKEDIAAYLEFLRENDISVSTINLGELLDE